MPETFHAGPNLGQLSDVTIIHGDCIEAMRELDDNSVDAVVTDPPYGLGFMGKEWDALPPGLPWAQECLRVLKPGGHLLAFGGTRTWHRLAVAVEDAGFEIRDSIAWLMGSGFPKSRNVSRDLDDRRCRCDAVELNRATTPQTEHDVSDLHGSDVSQAEGVGGGSRSVLLPSLPESGASADGHQTRTEVRSGQPGMEGRGDLRAPEGELHRTSLRTLSPGVSADGASRRLHHGAPPRDGSVGRADVDQAGVREPHQPGSARQPQGEPGVVPDERGSQARGSWPVCERCSQPVVPDGLGTALKPAFEPVVVGRKPFKGNVAQNVLAHGTGALNIDGCRIEGQPPSVPRGQFSGSNNNWEMAGRNGTMSEPHAAGRWPANVILDESQAAALDEQSAGTRAAKPSSSGSDQGGGIWGSGSARETQTYLDSGGASRFFYCAKAPKKERPTYETYGCICDHTREQHGSEPDALCIVADCWCVGFAIDRSTIKTNSHATVKPLTLMRWLVRLVTPPGGVVLDPFAGSGTTIEAALQEGFKVIGIEREADYLPMIQQRIARCLAS